MGYVMLFVLSSNLFYLIKFLTKETLYTNTVLSVESKCTIDKNRVDFHWLWRLSHYDVFVNTHQYFDPHGASYMPL